MKPRTTILGLMAVVAFMGVGLAALRSPSPLWDNALFTAALASFPVATVNVVFGRGRRRAFCGGFLVIGGTYFAAAFWPWANDSVRPHLVTTAVLDILYPRLTPSPILDSSEWARVTRERVEEARRRTRNPNDPAIRMLQNRLADAANAEHDVRERWAAWTRPPRMLTSGGPDLVSPDIFIRIGHSLLTIPIAVAGGLFARHRYVVHTGAEA